MFTDVEGYRGWNLFGMAEKLVVSWWAFRLYQSDGTAHDSFPNATPAKFLGAIREWPVLFCAVGQVSAGPRRF